jgi:hypothetical protein
MSFFEVITSLGKERIFRFSDSIDAMIVLKGRKSLVNVIIVLLFI